MKFKPVSEQEHKEIVELFHSDLGVQTIMQKYNRDYYTIKKIWLTEYHEGQFKARTTRLCRLHKVGSKNPMYGKYGLKHHNAVEKEINKDGYVMVFAPDWYSGKRDGNKVYEHIIVYCEHNGYAFIPKGMVVHHLDEDKQNNHPDNLVLLSIQDHRRIHAWLNKVQRLSRKGVGDSVPEVPDFLIQEVGLDRAKQLVEEGDIV
jgi:ribosomal silencing factor RsfS